MKTNIKRTGAIILDFLSVNGSLIKLVLYQRNYSHPMLKQLN